MPDETIEARAERLAKAREHWHDPKHPEFGTMTELVDNRGNYECDGDSPTILAYYGEFSTLGDGSRLVQCTLDHRTPAEQRAAVLDALSEVWAGAPDVDSAWIRGSLEIMYNAIQRTEGPQ